MTQHTCDFCGLKIDGWEHEAGFLSIKHSQSSCNPLEIYDNGHYQTCEIKFMDVCFNCSRKLSNGLVALLKSVRTKL